MPSKRLNNKVPSPGQITIAALRQLDPAKKEGSFEELMVRLLARLIRRPVRRARAGAQEGKDALSDDGALAIECKRYAESTSLSARYLISELEQVKTRHPSLQLWVLVATKDIGADQKEELDHAAHGKGLAVLYLDTVATGSNLGSIPAIVALCATDLEIALEFLSGVAGQGTRRLRDELEEIRHNQDFEPWVNWLREEIQNRLPIWRFAVERQNLALVKRIRETAFTTFGTWYDAVKSVPRQMSAQLDDWFRDAITVQSPDTPPVAVVLGERYDGKTWLVYQWLIEIAQRSQVPIFFVGSNRGLQSDRSLAELQIEDLSPALAGERSYAKSFIHYYRGQDVAKTPWALVVLDGLNEYAPNYRAWQRHLETALGRGELGCRSAVVLVTVRERSWTELKDFIPRAEEPADIAGRSSSRLTSSLATREMRLGSFSQEELRRALERLSLPPDLLENLPESARPLVRQPRYLGLLAHHRQRLGDFAAVTPEVLHWLDLCDKVGQTRQGAEDWGPAQYQQFMRGLAERWLDQRFLSETDIRRLLGDLTSQVPKVLAELRSEGILSGESGNYIVQPERLAIGYGLFLRESLLKASRLRNNLTEALRDLLAPFAEGDEAVDALRAASTLMLVEAAARTSDAGMEKESAEVMDILLGTWLNSRNLGRQDLEAIYELRRLLAEPLLRSWKEIWSNAKRDSRAREISVMIFGEIAESEVETKDRLRDAVSMWLRLVPLEGGWYQRERTKTDLKRRGGPEVVIVEEVAALLRSYVALPSLGHLRLQAVEGLDVTRLQTMSLYLVSRAPELVGPADLLAFTVVRVLLEEPIDSGDFWVIRRAVEDVPVKWFENELLRCGEEPKGILGKALVELVRISDRADLEGVKERLRRNAEAEGVRFASGLWPTKRNYKRLLQSSLGSSQEVQRFSERARWLLRDPSLLPLTKEQELLFARALRRSLSYDASVKGDMFTLQDFERLFPAMAVWAPTLGVEVLGRLLRGLPSRIQRKERTWLLDLRGHATLARGAVRRALLKALRLSLGGGEDRWLEQRELTLALLPDAALDETVNLLMAKENQFDHRETFNLAGALCTASDRRSLIDRLRAAIRTARIRRLRYLLTAAGGAPLPKREIEAISRTLAKGEAMDIVAAVGLAAQQGLTDIDPELLFPIAAGRVARETLGSDYASQLLVRCYKHEQIKEHLDTYWYAKSAGRRPEDAKEFLDEISAHLVQYKANRGAIDHRWHRFDLPSVIVVHLDRERVAEWTQAFNSWDGSWRWWGGLIRPAFEWCLINSDESARILWSQIRSFQPFQRERFVSGSCPTIDGVDCVIHALNRPEADDSLARTFLNELIFDARTDLELFEIALGARLRKSHRLRDLAQELSESPRAERRARGAAILGWLVEGRDRLKALRTTDSSLWVRRQAEVALQRHQVELWAKDWLERFLAAKTVAKRWAAGQLFLECADRRIDSWAWERVREGKLRRRLKGEAFLLLQAAQERAKKEADKLKSTLLGYRVQGLSTTAHPWRRDDEWILSRYGRRS
jgi:hypothetical protein